MTRRPDLLRRNKGASGSFVALGLAALFAITVATSAASATVVTGTSSLQARKDASLARKSAASYALQKRHGDDEDEEHDTAHSISHTHGHDDHDDHHEHAVAADMQAGEPVHDHKGPFLDSIPEATAAGDQLYEVPVMHVHGGHNHGGSGAPREHLNETSLFRAKGPDPLSYIEWDMAYGVGSLDQLQRFMTNDDVLGGRQMMRAVDGRWRKLFDEREEQQRKAIAADIASRIENGQQPARHGLLLAFHVAMAVLSCFFMLPAALALRAAHSTLAPLASLVYLVTLGGSLLLSVLYKALTPRLYPDNSHGSMGWAVFWISLACLGTDVFRLVGQIWAALRSSTSGAAGSRLDGGGGRSWRAVLSTTLGRDLPESSEKYDALEEEAMLASSGASDARELDVENDLAVHLDERHRSSPHHVHFDEGEYEEAGWIGSGSTAVGGGGGSGDEGRASPRDTMDRKGATVFDADAAMVSSPTTTACNTPRTSMFGDAQLGTFGLKSVSSWRGKLGGHSPSGSEAGHPSLPRETPFDAVTGDAASARARSGRLQKLHTVLRYTRVTVARSLPVIAFATAYTGLAVYTGSCRGGYKNTCLAHGIKGGIFFWFGLFTFSRYLGAYAECGWAWNRAPVVAGGVSSGEGGTGVKRRRTVPSAEFVEGLVIFVYGATNTWMERFGAKRGDPYTIKQIQHISIAVMFAFAGALTMLLELRSVRDLFSFPIALHHAAAVSMEEVRRRRRRTTTSTGSALDDDLAAALVQAQKAPPSYSASFNPFPALVIGVTGVAMAAHHQDYLYQVQIHTLWGLLLAGFAALRCLTYFLLWLRPPSSSILPSRPPTEALASFSLACGGLVFMLSSEEVSFAAMRSGYGDFMAILNVAVALVSLLFCWTAGLLILKGWAVRREARHDERKRRSNGMGESVRSSSAHPGAVEAGGAGVFVLEDEEEQA